MKNADTPASPLPGDAYSDFAHYDETKNTSYNPECQGLTKREAFAMAAMQGLCSNSNYHETSLARDAVCIADALFEELEKGKK